MKQQRATLQKQNAPRNKSGDTGGRPSCRLSLLGDPGAKFLVETGHRNRTTKNSLNYVSTCLKVVDTRRVLCSRLNLSIWQHGEQEKGPGLFSKRPRLSQHHVPVRKGEPGSRSQSKCKEKAFQKEICAEINRIAAQIVKN